MPLSPSLANWLNLNGHDATHTSDIGLSSAPDETIMQAARDEDRVVLTADLDYPRLLALAQAEGPGVILFRGGDYSERETLDRLKVMLEKVPVKDLPGSIIVIEKDRIRLRRLPVV
jgi:predicted nuclease of predicted toxin-antitoxin system